MAIPVQITSNSVNPGATTNVKAFSVNVTAGNLIFVLVANKSGNFPDTVTDNQGNSYTFWDLQQSGTAANATTWFAVAGSSGALTITVTWSTSEVSDIIIVEYPKGGGVPALDNNQSITNAATTGTSLGTGNITTTLTDDLLISWAYDGNRDGSPWTDSQSATREQTTVNPGGASLTLFDKASGTAGVKSDTMTAGSGVSGDNLIVGIIAFKNITLGPPPLSASCNTPPTGYVGSPYSHTFTASGGTSPYTFALSSGALPTGLSLNTSSGVLSGAPTAAGTFAFSILVTDSALATTTINCSILIVAASSAPFLNLVSNSITRLQAMHGTNKSPDNLQLVNVGGILYYFSKQEYPTLSGNFLTTVYKSDSTGLIWAAGASLSNGVNSSGTSTAPGMVVSGTKIWVLDQSGTIDGIGGLNFKVAFCSYDTTNNTWSSPSTGGPFAFAGKAMSVSALNNGTLLVTVVASTDAFTAATITQTSIYNPVTDTWTAPITIANYGAGAGNFPDTIIAQIHDVTSDNTVVFFKPGKTAAGNSPNLEAYVLSNTGALLNTPSAIYTYTSDLPINGKMGVPAVSADSPSGGTSAAFPFLDQTTGDLKMAYVDFSTFAQALETVAANTDFEPIHDITAYTQQTQGGWVAFNFNGNLYTVFSIDNGILNNASSVTNLYAKSRGGSATWSGLQLLFTSAVSREPLAQFKAAWTTAGPAILFNLWDPTINPASGTIAGLTSFILLPPGSPPPPPSPFQIRTLRFEVPQKRWFAHSYADTISMHYLDETYLDNVDNLQLLMLSFDLGFIYRNGGDKDNGTDITSIFTTPAMDGGDDRMQKLYVDVMTDIDNVGSVNLYAQFNNQVVNGPNTSFSVAGPRTRLLQNISSLASLNLYRNISLTYQWVGGPDGPRVYVCEPAGYAQPYISTFFVTQFINLAFPGWKHHRRLYAGYISNAPLLFTIKTQDGRTYGTYTLPSTGGQFKITPIMLDQAIKDLAFAYQIDGQGQNFALFQETFTIETKEWTEPSFIPLAIFKT